MEDYIISNDNDDDSYDDVLRFATHSGTHRLWLAVLISAIEVLRNENDKSHHDRGSARSFLFDKDNPFFDFVAESLGYSPGTLRGRIRKSLIRE